MGINISDLRQELSDFKANPSLTQTTNIQALINQIEAKHGSLSRSEKRTVQKAWYDAFNTFNQQSRAMATGEGRAGMLPGEGIGAALVSGPYHEYGMNGNQPSRAVNVALSGSRSGKVKTADDVADVLANYGVPEKLPTLPPMPPTGDGNQPPVAPGASGVDTAAGPEVTIGTTPNVVANVAPFPLNVFGEEAVGGLANQLLEGGLDAGGGTADMAWQDRVQENPFEVFQALRAAQLPFDPRLSSLPDYQRALQRPYWPLQGEYALDPRSLDLPFTDWITERAGEAGRLTPDALRQQFGNIAAALQMGSMAGSNALNDLTGQMVGAFRPQGNFDARTWRPETLINAALTAGGVGRMVRDRLANTMRRQWDAQRLASPLGLEPTLVNYARDLAQQLGFNVTNPLVQNGGVSPIVPNAAQVPVPKAPEETLLPWMGTQNITGKTYFDPADRGASILDYYKGLQNEGINASNIATADPRFRIMDFNTDVEQVPNQMVLGETPVPNQVYNRNTINTNVKEPDMGVSGQRMQGWTPPNIWENYFDQMPYA